MEEIASGPRKTVDAKPGRYSNPVRFFGIGKCFDGPRRQPARGRGRVEPGVTDDPEQIGPPEGPNHWRRVRDVAPGDQVLGRRQDRMVERDIGRRLRRQREGQDESDEEKAHDRNVMGQPAMFLPACTHFALK